MISDIDAVLDGSRQWVIIQGDNADVLPLIPDKGVTHVITDPPYEAEAHTKHRTSRAVLDGRMADASIDFAQMTPELRAFCGIQFSRVSRGWVLAFCQSEGVSPWRSVLETGGSRWRRAQIWVKPDASPQFTGDRPGCGHESIATAWCGTGRSRWNGGGSKGVYTHCIGAQNSGSLNEHPTTKPIALMLELVELFTDPGDIVLDPFCGSGTTGVACIRLGRRFIGIEKDAKYAAVAQERLLAESQGLNLRDARAGQLPMFGGDQ